MPIFSASQSHGDNDSLKRRLYPILFNYNVDLILSGHDHQMEYLISKKDGSPLPFEPKINLTDSLICGSMEIVPYQREVDFEKGDFLHQIIMGGSGAKLDKICPNRVTDMADLVYGNTNYGFAELYVDPTIITINYYGLNSSEPIFTANIHNYQNSTQEDF